MIKIEKILVFSIIIIISIIFIVTAISFITGRANPAQNLRRIETTPDTLVELQTNNTAYYKQLGTIRCTTKDENPIALVITPSFEYPTDDTAFYEEIFRKNKKLTLLIKTYFESFTKDQLLEEGEQKIKISLKELINAELILGKIEKVYLTEYIFLE